jgi:histidinol-phosphate aminotransferase
MSNDHQIELGASGRDERALRPKPQVELGASGRDERALRPKPQVEPSPRVAGISGYSVPRSALPIDLPLDGNEGLRPPPALLAACAEIQADAVRRYPSTGALAAALAARHGVDPGRVLVTAGADDALDRMARAMLVEGREIVLPVPSFEMIERYSRLAGGAIVEVPWPEGPYPRAGVLAAITERTAIVCVVTPNNPTGAVATIDDVRAVADAAPRALVLLDQAYGELADEDLTPLARDIPNVLVVRSLSKAFGLAGLRVGYALGAPEVIGWLRAAGGPFTVAGPSMHLAAARLALPPADVAAYVERIRFERRALFALLAELGYAPVPSQANFVLARCPDPVGLRDATARRGIGIRAFPGKKHLEDAVRITCPGDERDFERLTGALREAALELRK